MARNTSVTLSEHFTDFINRQVASGRYGSASEVVREGLRLLQDHEVQMERLRAALIEGEESGPSTPIDVEDMLAARRSVRA